MNLSKENIAPAPSSKCRKKLTRVLTFIAVLVMLFTTSAPPTFAAPIEGTGNPNINVEAGEAPGSTEDNDGGFNIILGSSALELIGGILDTIFSVAMYIGIVIFVIGIFMFIFAYKDDNAESQSRGARMAVIGAVLIGLKLIVKMTGLIE